ncbi:MAG: hypothetical protein ABWY78_12650, partial [Microvirga sp.]
MARGQAVLADFDRILFHPIGSETDVTDRHRTSARRASDPKPVAADPVVRLELHQLGQPDAAAV